jgi:acetylornithine deacetylase/succinyl-diaminopimelate desuccinylase-like protein
MTDLDPAERERKRRRHRNERIAAAVLILVVLGITLVVIDWSRRTREELGSDQSYIPKPVRMTPEVKMLQELVRFDSSKPEGVAATARWVASYLERNGIHAEVIESAPSMLNVYARIEGEKPGNGLLLFSHLDVVPADKEGWRAPPFEARLWGDQIVGRGTIDMKGILVCQLVAFVNVAKSGRKPAHDLVFLATAEEEQGSRLGMQWLLANRPELFAGVQYGITEGGITEMLSERMTWFGIEVGGKQYVYVAIAAPTREKILHARRTLEPFIFSRRPGRVVPEVRDYFAQLAPTRNFFRRYLEDIDATIRDGQFWRLTPTYRDLVQNSVVTGPPERAGDEWQMLITLLNLPDENPDDRLAWLAKTVAPAGAYVKEVRSKEGPTSMSSSDTPLFQLIAAEAQERYRVVAGVHVLYRTTSDARFLRTRGIDVYGVSPYPVNYYQSLAIHNADESVTVGAFQDGVEFLRDVVSEWAFE